MEIVQSLRKELLHRDSTIDTLRSDNMKARAEADRHRRELAKARQYVEKLKAALSLKAADIKCTAEALQHLASQNVERAQYSELVRENETLRQKLLTCKTLIADITNASATAARTIQAQAQQLRELGEQAARQGEGRAELDTLRARCDALVAEQGALRAENDALHAEVLDQRQTSQALQCVQDDLLAEFGRLQDQHDRAQDALQRLYARSGPPSARRPDGLDRDQDQAAQQEASQTAQQAAQQAAALARLRAELAEKRRAISRDEEEICGLRDKLATTASQLAAAGALTKRLQTQLAVLEDGGLSAGPSRDETVSRLEACRGDLADCREQLRMLAEKHRHYVSTILDISGAVVSPHEDAPDKVFKIGQILMDSNIDELNTELLGSAVALAGSVSESRAPGQEAPESYGEEEYGPQGAEQGEGQDNDQGIDTHGVNLDDQDLEEQLRSLTKLRSDLQSLNSRYANPE